ncbi:MAG: hypothetical protein R2741_09940 [Methanolobus sp.]
MAGETAPILLTGAAYFLPRLPDSIFHNMALPYHLYVLATSGTSITQTRPIQYGTALILLIIVLCVNLVAGKHDPTTEKASKDDKSHPFDIKSEDKYARNLR